MKYADVLCEQARKLLRTESLSLANAEETTVALCFLRETEKIAQQDEDYARVHAALTEYLSAKALCEYARNVEAVLATGNAQTRTRARANSMLFEEAWQQARMRLESFT